MNSSFGRFEKELIEFSGLWLIEKDYALADSGITPWLMRFDNIEFSGMWDDKPNLAAY